MINLFSKDVNIIIIKDHPSSQGVTPMTLVSTVGHVFCIFPCSFLRFRFSKTTKTIAYFMLVWVPYAMSSSSCFFLS